MFYNSLDSHLKQRFGKKVYRLPLDAGCTCPNRDGTCGVGGCIFCADSAYPESTKSVTEQLEAAKKKVIQKTNDNAFIAYFQSHTSTYGNLKDLEKKYREAIENNEVVALSIGTRPDCISDECLDLLKDLNSIKPVWIELGLQTMHDKTAKLINRGYDLSVFEECYRKLKEAGIEVIVHIICGLPGETNDDMRATVRYLSSLSPVLDGIKIQNLNVLKGTVLEKMFIEDSSVITIRDADEYIDLVIELIGILPKETVIHRITGDGPRKLLVSPLWVTDKKRILNTFRKKISEAPERTT